MGDGRRFHTEPRWRDWAIVVDGRKVGNLPRESKEIVWDAEGLAYVQASSGAELLAEVAGR